MKMKRFRLWLIMKLWPKGGCSWTANRFTQTAISGHRIFTLEMRDVTSPEEGWIGREEMFSMLRKIRTNERRMGWICPEPFADPVKIPQEQIATLCTFSAGPAFTPPTQGKPSSEDASY